jgi:hypothetical protein
MITEFPTLAYPRYNFHQKTDKGKNWIFDEIRKKWIVLTPEEWVRQHVIFYLVDQKGYLPGLIGVEKTVTINGLRKRYDIVCFNQFTEPLLIIECKAPEITLQRETIEQVNRYNEILRATTMMITNGINTFVLQKNSTNQQITYLNDIPSFEEIA